jgi:hypothetical protein
MPVQREERRERFEAHHTKEGKSHRRGDPGKEALVSPLTPHQLA